MALGQPWPGPKAPGLAPPASTHPTTVSLALSHCHSPHHHQVQDLAFYYYLVLVDVRPASKGVIGRDREGQRKAGSWGPTHTYDLLLRFLDKSSQTAAPSDPSGRIHGLFLPNPRTVSQ